MSFDGQDQALLDDWLVVGPANALLHTSPTAPHRTMLLGQSIELWRDAAGPPCGRVEGQAMCVMERYGYLWVCPSRQPSRPLFAFPEFDEPGRRIVDCGGVGVRASGLRIVENFLDMAHFPYVHPGVLGSRPDTEVVDYQVGIDAATGELWATECQFRQPRASAAASQGIVAQYRYRVMQPFCVMLYKTCVPYPERQDAIALLVQPIAPMLSIAHSLLVYFDNTSSDTELIAFQQSIFAQDKPILENHALAGLPLQGRLETATRADKASVRYRQWLRQRDHRYGVHAPATPP